MHTNLLILPYLFDLYVSQIGFKKLTKNFESIVSEVYINSLVHVLFKVTLRSKHSSNRLT